MSNTKHTPGPWFISSNSNYVRAGGRHGWNIAFIEDQEPYKEANAKLIAAAPDEHNENVENLKFLEWLATQKDIISLMWSDKKELFYKRIAGTKAAIKKATE
jgi:hypothetical protein